MSNTNTEYGKYTPEYRREPTGKVVSYTATIERDMGTTTTTTTHTTITPVTTIITTVTTTTASTTTITLLL